MYCLDPEQIRHIGHRAFGGCSKLAHLAKVDNRNPTDVSHWSSFAKWWTSRRQLVGPHREKTDVLWVTANHQNGLRDVPYYWAGVFVLEVARFLYPRQHFGLIDNDCVPDLVALATSQLKWTDLVGLAPDDQRHANKVGLLLVTEAHLEYNAGLVISLGSQGRPSPITQHSTAETLADDLADYRSQLLAMARPPENPTGTLQGGTMFTLDLVMVWALYGIYMCKTFWPRPVMPTNSTAMTDELHPIRWPKKAHPDALSEAGRERTPWLTRWARARFEQGCLLVPPHLEGPCKALSLAGEHLFQASRILPNRMRPVIFHAFGKAKHYAPKVLNQLAQLGWETLPIALLGMPHYPASWVVDTWKPIGGCCFTGSPVALAGNSAFRFCLLMRWHTIAVDPPLKPLGDDDLSDPEIVPVEAPTESNQEFLVRTLLQAADDQNSQESRSQATDTAHSQPPDPQRDAPRLFVPWSVVAQSVSIPEVQADPPSNLQNAISHAVEPLPEQERKKFRAAHETTLQAIPTLPEPVETLAPLVMDAIYTSGRRSGQWETVLWHMAMHHRFWLTAPYDPPPDCIHIHCGGLGGGTLGGPNIPTFHCTNPRVDGTCVYGPSLTPVDRPGETVTGVAAGSTTSLHELTMLMALTSQPCERWQELGFGRAALFYRRTQITLEAARLLPAHRRLPHATVLNGLWWKLLAAQPERILTRLPHLRQSCHNTSAEGLYFPREFRIEGFSAGSYTGAVLFLALRTLFPDCRVQAKLGAVAMPKRVFAAVMAAAAPGRCRVHLIHAEEDMLCDWQPSQVERHVISHRLEYTLVTESAAKWMGSSKHQYQHWLRCQLPRGRHSLTDLKLSHPEVIPTRDRMAAPLRLASWIRFETVMDRRDWSTAIEMLVPEIDLPDEALLRLLGRCVPGQQITSMAEAQALLLRNFRVGGAQQSDCANWLTAVTRDLLAPIPFREVFVILALFLPQLPFAEGAGVENQLWSSPVAQQVATEVQVTPVAQGLRGMNEYRIVFPAHSRVVAFCSPETTGQQLSHLSSIPPEKIRIGCQVGKVYRIVFQENAAVFSVGGTVGVRCTTKKEVQARGC